MNCETCDDTDAVPDFDGRLVRCPDCARRRLIAAAPELLAALERIVNRSFGTFVTEAEAVTVTKVPLPLIEEARAAIAKARNGGGQ